MKKSYIPNFLTFLNLAFGIVSLIMTAEGKTERAALFILGAGIIDRYDGKIARMMTAESSIGKELDSLADNVSFGVAPAVLIYFMYSLRSIGPAGISAVIIYCVCGMYRLARYNSTCFEGTFTGVPITICGTCLALMTLFLKNENPYGIWVMTLSMILFSYLMVSRFTVRKR